jgi:hypothetical protein
MGIIPEVASGIESTAELSALVDERMSGKEGERESRSGK